MNKVILATAGLIVMTLAAQLAAAQSPPPAAESNDSNASPADADLADRVRRSVIADRDLSSYAAKIVIVATDGNVHLTGLVQNDGERAQIASKAAALAGQRHVVNELRIMTNVPDGAGLRALLEQASAPRAVTSRGAVTAAN